MLHEEAVWIGEAIRKIPKEDLFPILNIGSSSLLHRKEVQSDMQVHIFDYLENSGKVIHSDIKDAEGVDIVGDITNPDFVNELRKLSIKSVICTNFLEHIVERDSVIRNLENIIPDNGNLIISVPYRYPYHFDPIDTMYRPGLSRLSKEFPKLTIIEGKIVKSNDTYWRRFRKDKRLGFIILTRIFFPFYKPMMWWNTVRYYPFIFSKFQTSCAIFKKQ